MRLTARIRLQAQQAGGEQAVPEYGEAEGAAAGRTDRQVAAMHQAETQTQATTQEQQQQYVPRPPSGMSGGHGPYRAPDPASLSDEDRLFPTNASATAATTTAPPTTATSASFKLPSNQPQQPQPQQTPEPSWRSIDELRSHHHDFACGPAADVPCAVGGVVVVALDDSDDAAAAAAFAAKHLYKPGKGGRGRGPAVQGWCGEGHGCLRAPKSTARACTPPFLHVTCLLQPCEPALPTLTPTPCKRMNRHGRAAHCARGVRPPRPALDHVSGSHAFRCARDCCERWQTRMLSVVRRSSVLRHGACARIHSSSSLLETSTAATRCATF